MSYPGNSLGGVLPLCRDAVCVFFSPSRPTFVGGVLPLRKDAVIVFYSRSRLGNPGESSLGESYPSVEMQFVSLCLQPQPTGSCWRSFTSQERCSYCILQPQPTWQSRRLVGRVLPLCWDAVCVLCSPSLPALVGGVLPLRKDAVIVFYSRSRLGNPGDSLGESYPSVENAVCVLCSPSLPALVGGVLPLRKDAVIVFYSRSRRGNPGDSLGESYPSVEMQFVSSAAPAYRLLLAEFYLSGKMQLLYFTAAADLAIQETRWASLTPLLRCSLCLMQPQPTGSCWRSFTSQERCSYCILQPQPTRQSRRLVGGVLPLCWDAVCVFCSPSLPALVGGVLPLWKDAVSVFYSPSRLGHCFDSLFA